VGGTARADILLAVDGSTIRLRLRVSPGAGRPGIVGRHGEAWKVRVTAGPERGKANDAVIDLLARALGVPRANVELIGGRGSRDKILALHGLTADEVGDRLEAAAGAAPGRMSGK
jgi:uncharacterized protein